MPAHSLYIHIPFCRHRCAYCDFNTYAGLGDLVEPYMLALIKEVQELASVPVGTVFVGGGTPSLVPVSLLGRMLEAVRGTFDLNPRAEITLEANPGTVSPSHLSGLREIGVNRISMGMQSSHPDDLRFLEREHDYFAVAEAVLWARRAGFDNLNLDLIFGLPHQPFERWQQTLQHAIDLGPEHLSVYSLILEHGTPLEAWVQRGLVRAPDENLAGEMYLYSIEALAESGFVHYEISNWAKERDGDLLASLHNLQYWRNLPYLGLGAGAHGFAGGYRTVNVLAPGAYIQRMKNPASRDFPRTGATSNISLVDRATEMGETMMMGLRLVQEGVSDSNFKSRFGNSIESIYPEEMKSLQELGLVEKAGDPWKLTKRGILFGNQVFMRFV